MYDCFRLHPIICNYSITKTQTIIRDYPKRRLFHLSHNDYFNYFFRHILLRIAIITIIVIMCIIFIASNSAAIVHIIVLEMNYCDYFFQSQLCGNMCIMRIIISKIVLEKIMRIIVQDGSISQLSILSAGHPVDADEQAFFIDTNQSFLPHFPGADAVK